MVIALGRITKHSARFYERSVAKPSKPLNMSEHKPLELENHQFLTNSKVAEHELGPKEAFLAGDVDSSWETMGGIG